MPVSPAGAGPEPERDTKSRLGGCLSDRAFGVTLPPRGCFLLFVQRFLHLRDGSSHACSRALRRSVAAASDQYPRIG